MKITYTAPNRAHHYPYAEAMHRANTVVSATVDETYVESRSDVTSINQALYVCVEH